MDGPCQTNSEMQNGDGREAMRIALVGRSGTGKSAVGNTLLGKIQFRSKCIEESVTDTMSWCVGEQPNSKRCIKVVDTPGIINIKDKNKEVKQEIEKALNSLSPGPHAILIVVSPGRLIDQKIIAELKELFLCDGFLEFSIIVMVRKNEIKDDNGQPIDIHTFVEERTADEFQELYKMCSKRIVAVENVTSWSERSQYAQDIMTAIDNIGGGYFNLNYREVERIKQCDIS